MDGGAWLDGQAQDGNVTSDDMDEYRRLDSLRVKFFRVKL
jgi:hypothetical protein